MLVALGPWSGHKEGMIKKSLSLPPEVNSADNDTNSITVVYFVLLCTALCIAEATIGMSFSCLPCWMCCPLCTPLCEFEILNARGLGTLVWSQGGND